MFAGSIGTRRYTLAFATFSFLIPVNRAITEHPATTGANVRSKQVSGGGRLQLWEMVVSLVSRAELYREPDDFLPDGVRKIVLAVQTK